ncbi:MAG: hypothetical protein CYPHOPRED_000517 [Cyphobasidiales sp. Tagirdzhanova-0007]|nr:MAG: hypothetical protein CYPHOPRED_000517 [Cyphobasidiales sp. Tagirdzhanova-0007]
MSDIALPYLKLLTLLGFLPGLIHAIWLVIRRADREEKSGVRTSNGLASKNNVNYGTNRTSAPRAIYVSLFRSRFAQNRIERYPKLKVEQPRNNQQAGYQQQAGYHQQQQAYQPPPIEPQANYEAPAYQPPVGSTKRG